MEPERITYDLTPESVVLDLGCFMGDFAYEIATRYGCRVLAYEPVREWAEACQERLAPYNVEVCSYGLDATTKTAWLPVQGDRTGLYAPDAGTGHLEECTFIDILDELTARNLQAVDLIKINVEGAEYPILRRLLDAGRLPTIRHLQVQFHTFVPEFGERYKELERDLQATHELSWRWPFVWESWRRIA